MPNREPLPIIDPARCQGSGDCMAVCPTETLDVWMEQAWVKYPNRCLSCGACALICPTQAITLPNPADIESHP
ncbi:4Fe-4S binding protein [bacterium]|jgi:ferredoxin|nr:4Fe-4S binding protein [bacterium]